MTDWRWKLNYIDLWLDAIPSIHGSRPEYCEVAYQSERSETAFVISSHFRILHSAWKKKYQDQVLISYLKKTPKHIKSLHSISLMLNIKRSACQTIPLFYLESTVIQNASISSVCVGWICLYHVRLKSKIRKTVTKWTSFIMYFWWQWSVKNCLWRSVI